MACACKAKAKRTATVQVSKRVPNTAKRITTKRAVIRRRVK